MVDPVTFLVAVLACWRVAQLIVIDEGPVQVFARFRRWTGQRVNASTGVQRRVWEDLAELVRCPYCVGVWVALVAAVLAGPSNLSYFVLVWFGIAGGQALIEMCGGLRDGTD